MSNTVLFLSGVALGIILTAGYYNPDKLEDIGRVMQESSHEAIYVPIHP